MKRTPSFAATSAAALASLCLVVGGAASVRAETQPRFSHERPVFHLDVASYASPLGLDGNFLPYGLTLGAQVLRWDRLSIGLELDLTYRSETNAEVVDDATLRDIGALAIAELDLLDRGSGGVVPYLTAGAGMMHSQVSVSFADKPEFDDDTTFAPAFLVGAGVTTVGDGSTDIRIGVEYLWWEADDGRLGPLTGNLGGLRVKVGLAKYFTPFWER